MVTLPLEFIQFSLGLDHLSMMTLWDFIVNLLCRILNLPYLYVCHFRFLLIIYRSQRHRF